MLRVITVLNRNMAKMGETMRDQMYHLDKTRTVALMTERRYTEAPSLTMEFAAAQAEALYHAAQKVVENDNVITGRIPAA